MVQVYLQVYGDGKQVCMCMGQYEHMWACVGLCSYMYVNDVCYSMDLYVDYVKYVMIMYVTCRLCYVYYK